MNVSMLDQLKGCLRTSVPLVAINTPDEIGTQRFIAETFTQKRPLLTWDIMEGLRALNDKGATAARSANIDPALTQNPAEALVSCKKLPSGSLSFFHNLHLAFERDAWSISQALTNLRDPFKANERMVIALGSSFVLPPEVSRNFITIDEPYPSHAALRRLVVETFANARLPAPTDESADQCARILLGTSLFEAEQLAFLSLTPAGMDQSVLFARKRALIAQTPGTTLADPAITLNMVGGHEALIARMTRVVNGRANVGAIIFMDEIEKAMAGAQGDTSGVSGDQHGALLSWMADNKVLATLYSGCPGSGKSWVALYLATLKRLGTLPFLRADMGAMKSSLVGSSEARFRNFLKTARALTDDALMLVATTNDYSALSPELRSRMTLGTYHFEPPTLAERAKIWPIYLGTYNLGTWDTLSPEMKAQPWTGREIAACCQMAWNEQISLEEASTSIVPVVQTDAERLARLREAAHNTFLSTVHTGTYSKSEIPGAEDGPARNVGWNV